MKTIILIWLAAAAVASSAIHAGGRGFFPVMVQVVHAGSGTPIKGANVRLEGAGEYKEMEIVPERQTKILPGSLGKVIKTNDLGVAVAFYYGGWASTESEGKSTYSREIKGTIIVEHDGKEIFRESLEAWAEKNQFNAGSKSVPWVVVSLPAKE